MTLTTDPLLIARNASSPLVAPEIGGSKAAQLWHMAQLGLDVPPAFVLPTTLCAAVNAGDKEALDALRHGLGKGIAWLEEVTDLRFGDSRAPLLVSVRSGAALSMPGMLETILDVGLNDQTVRGLNSRERQSAPRLRQFSPPRAGLCRGREARCRAFNSSERLTEMMRREGVESEIELDPEALERLTLEFRELVLALYRTSNPGGSARAARRPRRSPSINPGTAPKRANIAASISSII